MEEHIKEDVTEVVEAEVVKETIGITKDEGIWLDTVSNIKLSAKYSAFFSKFMTMPMCLDDGNSVVARQQLFNSELDLETFIKNNRNVALREVCIAEDSRICLRYGVL